MTETKSGISDRNLKTAWALVLGGFIPFGSLAIAVFLNLDLGLSLTVSELFIAWSLVILSFLGGIRWGMAVSAQPLDIASIALSVVPCIIGWFSLLLSDFYTVLVLLVLYVFHGFWDYTSLSDKPWFAKIRLVLTGLVSAAHVLVLMA